MVSREVIEIGYGHLATSHQSNLKMRRDTLKDASSHLVLPTGFEPAIFAVRGRCPEPLDDGSRQELKDT